MVKIEEFYKTEPTSYMRDSRKFLELPLGNGAVTQFET